MEHLYQEFKPFAFKTRRAPTEYHSATNSAVHSPSGSVSGSVRGSIGSISQSDECGAHSTHSHGHISHFPGTPGSPGSRGGSPGLYSPPTTPGVWPRGSITPDRELLPLIYKPTSNPHTTISASDVANVGPRLTQGLDKYETRIDSSHPLNVNLPLRKKKAPYTDMNSNEFDLLNFNGRFDVPMTGGVTGILSASIGTGSMNEGAIVSLDNNNAQVKLLKAIGLSRVQAKVLMEENSVRQQVIMHSNRNIEEMSRHCGTERPIHSQSVSVLGTKDPGMGLTSHKETHKTHRGSRSTKSLMNTTRPGSGSTLTDTQIDLYGNYINTTSTKRAKYLYNENNFPSSASALETSKEEQQQFVKKLERASSSVSLLMDDTIGWGW